MAKITGKEPMERLPAKAVRLYRAVAALIAEGAVVGTLKVAQITERAGIGKGTAYAYFDTREEIIVYALIFFMEETAKKLEEEIEEKEKFAEKMELCMVTHSCNPSLSGLKQDNYKFKTMAIEHGL